MQQPEVSPGVERLISAVVSEFVDEGGNLRQPARAAGDMCYLPECVVIPTCVECTYP